jgi:polysaccharide export outer membrane protein
MRWNKVILPVIIFTVIALLKLEILTAHEYQEYKVGAADVLEISIYDQPDLSRKITVLQDGTINFPLIGSIQVAGKSVGEIAELIRELLEKDYLYNPYVTVTVQEFRSKKISVLGNVKEPGIYYLEGPTTLLDIISKAGTIKSADSIGKIIIQHDTNPGRENNDHTDNEITTINLSELLFQGKRELNIYLRNGDNIYVPEANQFFILGEIRKPGLYNLTENLTILKAISIAGGFTEFANSKRISIIRADNAGEQKIYINVDDIIKKGMEAYNPILQAGDVVMVPKRFF